MQHVCKAFAPFAVVSIKKMRADIEESELDWRDRWKEIRVQTPKHHAIR